MFWMFGGCKLGYQRDDGKFAAAGRSPKMDLQAEATVKLNGKVPLTVIV